MSYQGIITVDTDGSVTDTLVTGAFTTSGSNRHADVVVNIASSSAATAGTPTRTGDTYVKQRNDGNPTGSALIQAEFWMSTAEPVTGSQAMQIVISAARQYWGFTVGLFDDVDQTTRIRGGTVTLNPDGDGAIANLAVASPVVETGDTVASYISGGASTIPTTNGGQDGTFRGSWLAGTNNGWGCLVTAAGASSLTFGFNNGGWRHVHYVASHPPPSETAPSVAVPGDGQCIDINHEISVSGDTVTEGSSAITAVATTCTAGATMTYSTTGTSVTLSGNGTNAVTLLTGASTEEYNAVLATRTMRGTTPDTTITVTVIPTDGTLNDSDSFDVYCDPYSLTATGDNADVIAWVASVKVRILSGQTHDTVDVHVEDDTGTPIEVDSSFVVGLSSFFQGVINTIINIYRRRRRN